MIVQPNGNLFIRENATAAWPVTFTPPFNSINNLDDYDPFIPSPHPLPPRGSQSPPPPHETPLPLNTRPIHVFQNNVNRSSPITHAILNDHVLSKDIILIQEPWTGFIGTGKSDTCSDGTPIFGMPHQSSWNAFLPTQISVDRSSNPRVAAYVNRRLKNCQISVRADISSHRDILILELRSRKRSLLIVNLYNDDHNTAVDALYALHLPGDVPTIITGDFNLHHPLWSIEDPAPRSTGKASDLVEWMESNAFHLCNSQGEVTFQRPHRNSLQSSVLDLTWINDAALSLGCLKDWTVSPDLHTSSDHLPITWTSYLASEIPAPSIPDTPVFQYVDEMANEWTQAFLGELSNRMPPGTGLPDETERVTFGRESRTPSPDADPAVLINKCKKQVSNIMEAMSAASSRTLKIRTFHPKASPWYTDEVAEVVAETKRARTSMKAFSGAPDQQVHLRQYRLAARKLKRVIRKAKRDWAMAFAGQVSRQDVWKLTAWYKGIRKTGTPTLKDPISGRDAVSLDDKKALFSDTFFPPPPFLEDEADFLKTPLAPRDDTRCLEPLSLREVEAAIRSCANDTAPGITGVPYRAIKWAWRSPARTYIFNALATCLQSGFHAPQWKSSITVVIPKPGKPSYSTPRAYRPIQLLECLGKIMEKIVASRLMFDISKYNLVPHEQFGGRRASSCTDAALSLTHDIQSGWKKGLVSSFLCIDVKGFFDNVNHARMTRILWEMGFPIEIVKWVRSFLSNRSTAFRIDGVLHPVQDINIGIPQGSPCSPVLSIIYAAEVISDLVDAQIITSNRIPLSPRAYIDDLGLLAISKSLDDNVKTLRLGLIRVIHKLSTIGMSIDPSKLEIQHFSRRPRESLLPQLTMTHPIDGSQIKVTPTEYTWWLGFFLDKRLTFSRHVEIMCKRASSVINGLRCLGNTVRGLSQKHFRLLYISCVFPILTYGATVWYRSHKNIKTLVKKLEVVQNKAIRLITGAFKTTPVKLIQLRSFLPPIEIWLKKLNQQAATRLHKLPLLSPMIQRLPDIWRNRSKPEVTTPFSTPFNFGLNTGKLTDLHSLAAGTPASAEKLEPFHSENTPWAWDARAFPDHLDIDHSTCLPGEIPGRIQAANRLLDSSSSRPDILIGYCDGSKMTRAGYGIVIYHENTPVFEKSVGLGSNNSAFDGEMWALTHSLIKINSLLKSRTLKETVRSVLIYSDCVSALQVISDPSAHPGQLASLIWRKQFLLLREDHPEVKLRLSWIPGHHGSRGNEKADQLAKIGTTRAALLPPSFAALKEKAKTKVRYRWNKQLKDEDSPSMSPDAAFETTPREIFGRITQISSRHGYLGEYYLNFVFSESPWCSCADEVSNPTLQTREHILYDCPRYADHRYLINDRPFKSLINPKEGLHDFIKFLKRSGAFTKMGLPLPDPPPLPQKKKAPDK